MSAFDNLSPVEIFAACIGVLIAVAVLSIVLAIPIMLCWNWVAAGVLGLPVLTLMESWGLGVLCAFLFKSPHYNSKS